MVSIDIPWDLVIRQRKTIWSANFGKIGNKKSAIIVEAVAQYLESHPEINMDCRRIQVKIKPDISWAELEEKIRSIIDEKISVAQASGGLENTGSQPIIADADIDEMLHNLDLFD